jgi:hypothetical protein
MIIQKIILIMARPMNQMVELMTWMVLPTEYI